MVEFETRLRSPMVNVSQQEDITTILNFERYFVK